MAATAARGAMTGFYCPTCEAARYFETSPDPDWVFCPECGTKMGDLASRPRYAGFWRRFAGYLIDTALIYGLLGILLLALWRGLAMSSATVDWLLLAWTVLGFAYLWIGNARGATLGKLALGLRLVNRHGKPPGLRAGAIRLVISWCSGLVFSYGYWRMLFHDNKQTLHDTAADTYVVRR